MVSCAPKKPREKDIGEPRAIEASSGVSGSSPLVGSLLLGFLQIKVPNRRLSYEPVQRKGPAILTEELILKEGIRAEFSDQLWPEYEQRGDANAFAASYTEFMRAFTEAPLFAGLDADRTPADHERLANEYFKRMRSLIEANPKRARWDWHVALLRVAKRGQSPLDTNQFVTH